MISLNKILKIAKSLFHGLKIQTTNEIRERIISGDLTVDYGQFFLGYDDQEKYFLGELSKSNLPYTRFKIPCFLINDVGIFIDDEIKTIKFHRYDWCDESPVYNHLEIDHDIAEVTTGSFAIPSGLLFLTNNFSEKINPEPEYGQFNINYYQDRKRITKWYLENNQIAYGQMGNMSLNVYYNENTNHIILGRNLDCLEDKTKEGKRYRKLLKGYNDMGDISLSMWRWEAADSQTVLSQSTFAEEKEIIQIPVDGTIARFEHYYGTLNESPLTDYCYAQIWIS